MAAGMASEAPASCHVHCDKVMNSAVGSAMNRLRRSLQALFEMKPPQAGTDGFVRRRAGDSLMHKPIAHAAIQGQGRSLQLRGAEHKAAKSGRYTQVFRLGKHGARDAASPCF